MGASTNTEVIDFTGGMNTLHAKHLIAKSEAQVLVNVDIRNGSLLSNPKLRLVTQAMDRYFYQFNDSMLYYNTFRSNAMLGNNLYWSDGVTTGKVLWDGRELPLGIDSPVTPCDLTAVPGTPPTADPFGTHTGDFKYTYTFYDTTTDAESAPAPLPPYITVDRQDIQIGGLEALPTNADEYRIYRIGGYLPRFTLVAQITPTETPYLDNLDDTEIDGRLLHTLRSGAPLDGLQDFTELNGRLFGSLGENLYYSALGNPDAWYINDFFTLPDDITGVAKSPAGLLVFGERYTYMLVGNSPQNFRLKIISGILGCIARESIAYIDERAIWLGETGIFTSNGYTINNLTQDKIEEISTIQPTSSAVINEVYYLHYVPSLNPSESLFPSDLLFPASSKGTNALNEGIITLDFKRGSKYSYALYQHDNLASVGIKDGELHVITVIPNTIFLDCEEPLGCTASLQCTAAELSKFGDSTERGLTQLLYSSPQFIDGSFSTLKQYDKIRLNLWGIFKVQVIFSNGEVVLEETITSLFRGNELSIDDYILEFEQDNVTIMGIPNNNNTSYSIGFIISGVGVIKSIQYSWKARELSN